MMSLIIKAMIIAAVIFGVFKAIQYGAVMLGWWVIRMDIGEAKYDELMKTDDDNIIGFYKQYFNIQEGKGQK